jgi:hypothetical protein
LSTAIGNRHLPSDEGVTASFWFRFVFVANAARCGSCAVQVLYQTAASADSGQGRNGPQRRENRSDNFFQFVTEWMHGVNPQFAHRA